MKKRNALFLALLLIQAVLLPAGSMAGDPVGVVEVTVNGATKGLWWDTINILKGQMKVTVCGFEEIKGKDFGWLAVISQGQEIRAKSAKDDGKGNCVYQFDCSALPSAILFYPNDDSGKRIVLWAEAGSSPGNTESSIPYDCTGTWEGTAVPVGAGEEKILSVVLNSDGSGQYTAKGKESASKFPVAVEVRGREFSAVVADGVMPVTALRGTWKYQRMKLKLEVTAVFRDGTEETYTAELRRAKDPENAED